MFWKMYSSNKTNVWLKPCISLADVKEKDTWGSRDGTTGRHLLCISFIPSILYVPLALQGVLSECKAKSNAWELMGMAQN